MRKRHRAFTTMELIIVVAIAAVILAIGMLRYRQQMMRQRFRVACDNLVQQIKQAQAEARAYGQMPSGYSDDLDGSNNQTRDYKVFLINNGIQQPMRYKEYKNLTLNFNFMIKPMREDNLKNNFKGVCLAFGYPDPEHPARYKYDNMIIFGPTGAPVMPTSGGIGPFPVNIQGKEFKDEFAIQVLLKGGNKILLQRWILINSKTGLVRTDESDLAPEETPTTGG